MNPKKELQWSLWVEPPHLLNGMLAAGMRKMVILLVGTWPQRVLRTVMGGYFPKS